MTKFDWAFVPEMTFGYLFMKSIIELPTRTEKLRSIAAWAEQNDDVRVMLLTSSLVNPLAPVDEFSDLDIELVFRDSTPYVMGTDWVQDLGATIAIYEEDESAFEGKHAMKMVLYADHVKVDFKLYGVPQFIREVSLPVLPEGWDLGYKVVVDKDGLTRNLARPTYQSTIIRKPSRQVFEKLLFDFWWDTTYVAKCLARGDLFYAKFMTENIIRTHYLVPLIEWYIASQHDWNVTTNKHGRLFKQYLPGPIWHRIEQTFSGSQLNENWDALFAMGDLVKEIGGSVASQLSYQYPVELEDKMRCYWKP